MADFSFDIVNTVDGMEADNAVNQAHKEISNRYDFRGVEASVKRNEQKIVCSANTEERANAVYDVLLSKWVKRGLSPKSLKSSKPIQSGKVFNIEIQIIEGIMKEQAKQLSAFIRDNAPKSVKCQIQGEELRISSKSKDALQEIISLVKMQELDFVPQFTNFR